MIISQARGHEIVYYNSSWVYVDNGLQIDDKRPCKKCGLAPLESGADACIGNIDGVKSACCGHGVSQKIIIRGEP